MSEGIKANLYQKISKIMDDVQRLSKDTKVGEGTYSYKAISEEKVTTAIREAMIKHGVVIFPIEQEHICEQRSYESNGKAKFERFVTVNVKYRLVNTDDPKDYIEVVSSGTASDQNDKGIGKAMTYCYKYALLRTFAIPTGEDPDRVFTDDERVKDEDIQNLIVIAAKKGLTAKALSDGIIKDFKKSMQVLSTVEYTSIKQRVEALEDKQLSKTNTVDLKE